MKFNQDLAAIHGYLCGDGYISSRNLEPCIKFTNTNLKLVKDFKKRIESLWNIKHRITIKKVKNKKDLYCYSATKKEIYEELIKYGPYHTENWEIPIKYLDRKGLRLWLRAFFDCEAWLQFRPHQTRTIAIHSLNHNGLIQIQKQLKDVFNINSVVTKRKTRNISYLGIYGKDDLIKFQKEINFLHDEKRKKLKNIINSYTVYIWQFPKEPDKLKKFIKNLIRKRARSKLCKGRPIYVRLFSIIEGNLKKLAKNLDNLYGIKSKIYRSVNGNGTVYYELSIQDIYSIKKMLENGLISKSLKAKLSFATSERS